MTIIEQIQLLKAFANERFGSLRRMSAAVGKSPNYFAEYFAKEKLPPPFILRKLIGMGLPKEEFESAFVASLSPEISQKSTAMPVRSAREEYEAIEMYGGKPDWVELPDDVRMAIEQRFALYQLDVQTAEDTFRDEYERLTFEHDSAIKRASSAFQRSLIRQLLGEPLHDTPDF